MEETKSRNSSTYKGSNKRSENSAGTSKTATTTKDVSDKKKLKVLKKALLEERSKTKEQAIEIDALKKRNQELEKEYTDINNKYLETYEENDKLQEQVHTLQYKMSSGGTGAKVGNLAA